MTSFDIEELFMFGEKVIETYEGLLYTETFEKPFFQEIYWKMFRIRLKRRKVGNVVKKKLMKDTTNSIDARLIEKNLTFNIVLKVEHGWTK